jgi:hypothetical protein
MPVSCLGTVPAKAHVAELSDEDGAQGITSDIQGDAFSGAPQTPSLESARAA